MADTSRSPAGGPAVSPALSTLYELQRPFVEPLLQCCRLTNMAFDILFYDVGVLASALLAKGLIVDTTVPANASARHPLASLDLTAQTNPSGCVIVMDASLAPFVRKPFLEMKEFFDYANGEDGKALHTLTVTGVGSSAFGSVALAWDVSKALGEPVAAIVPGYGLADIVPQALGGWFGFEMYDLLQSATQKMLAKFSPSLAMMGKQLALSTPGRQMSATGVPVFLHGSAASDDVHAILQAAPGILRVIGHSKGALAIENALRSLKPERTKDIYVRTLGCVISEAVPCRDYVQYLGWIDFIGIINSGNNPPEHRPLAHHSTNALIPLSMAAGDGAK